MKLGVEASYNEGLLKTQSSIGVIVIVCTKSYHSYAILTLDLFPSPLTVFHIFVSEKSVSFRAFKRLF